MGGIVAAQSREDQLWGRARQKRRHLIIMGLAESMAMALTGPMAMPRRFPTTVAIAGVPAAVAMGVTNDG